MRPQVPPLQPPEVQVPWPPPHDAALATQVRLFWLQQPPLSQVEPSQHGSPGPPQLRQVPAAHATSLRVQKSDAPELLLGSPGQQGSPLVPQALVRQPRLRHMPTAALPQVSLFARHVPALQHALPTPSQSFCAQHG
jgi:hypothetical protein